MLQRNCTTPSQNPGVSALPLDERTEGMIECASPSSLFLTFSHGNMIQMRREQGKMRDCRRRLLVLAQISAACERAAATSASFWSNHCLMRLDFFPFSIFCVDRHHQCFLKKFLGKIFNSGFRLHRLRWAQHGQKVQTRSVSQHIEPFPICRFGIIDYRFPVSIANESTRCLGP